MFNGPSISIRAIYTMAMLVITKGYTMLHIFRNGASREGICSAIFSKPQTFTQPSTNNGLIRESGFSVSKPWMWKNPWDLGKILFNIFSHRCSTQTEQLTQLIGFVSIVCDIDHPRLIPSADLRLHTMAETAPDGDETSSAWLTQVERNNWQQEFPIPSGKLTKNYGKWP